MSLPIGARIQLDDVDEAKKIDFDWDQFPSGHADAIVTGIRIWGAQSMRPALVLEVEVKETGSDIWSVSNLS